MDFSSEAVRASSSKFMGSVFFSEFCSFFNSSFKNSQNFENFVLDKDKIKTKWKNENFIILQRGTGSEAWINSILPIKKNEKFLQTDQVLAFDPINNIIVRQNYNSEEYPFQLINLKNLEKDSIRFETKNCESINIINCIDKIDFNEKTLIINWTTPNNFKKKEKNRNCHLSFRKILQKIISSRFQRFWKRFFND